MLRRLRVFTGKHRHGYARPGETMLGVGRQVLVPPNLRLKTGVHLANVMQSSEYAQPRHGGLNQVIPAAESG